MKQEQGRLIRVNFSDGKQRPRLALAWHSVACCRPLNSFAALSFRFGIAIWPRYWLLVSGGWRPVRTVFNSDTLSFLPLTGETGEPISAEISAAHSREECRPVHTPANNWRAIAEQLTNTIGRCHSSDFTGGPSHNPASGQSHFQPLGRSHVHTGICPALLIAFREKKVCLELCYSLIGTAEKTPERT